MERLATELKALRRDRRINSQEELARLAGVSATTIKKIEAASIGEVKPSTLRLLAGGLAADLDGRVDRELTERFYRRLVQAAGFLPADVAPEPSISRAAFIADMEKRTGRHDLAVAMSSVAWDYDRIPERYRSVIEAAILALANARSDEDEQT